MSDFANNKIAQRITLTDTSIQISQLKLNTR